MSWFNLNPLRAMKSDIERALRKSGAPPLLAHPSGMQKAVATPVADRLGLLTRPRPANLYPVTATIDLDAGLWARGRSPRTSTLYSGAPDHPGIEASGKGLAVLSETGTSRIKEQDAGLSERLAGAHDRMRQEHTFRLRGEEASVSLDWAGGDVSHVFIDRETFGPFMDTYRAAVGRGEAPGKLGGRPWIEFFRPTDDFRNELQVEALTRLSPGFRTRAPEERRAVAALAHRIAEGQEDVPLGLRLATAEAMIRHERIVPGPESRQAWKQLASRERLAAHPFHHGTRAGDAIAQEGFIPAKRQLLGTGVYHGNPSVASVYALERSGSFMKSPPQIVSGKVLPGSIDPLTLGHDIPIESAASGKGMVGGAHVHGGPYWVTKDPHRFQVRGITTYDSSLAPSRLGTLVPDLLDNLTRTPSAALWSLKWLSKLDGNTVDRAALAALSGQDFAEGSRLWLASRGHEPSLIDLVSRFGSMAPGAGRQAAGVMIYEGLGRTPPATTARLKESMANAGTLSEVRETGKQILSRLTGERRPSYIIWEGALGANNGARVRELAGALPTWSDESHRIAGASALLDALLLARRGPTGEIGSDAIKTIETAATTGLAALDPSLRERLAGMRPEFRDLLQS